MKLGLGLPHLGDEATPQKIVGFAQRAEVLGFDATNIAALAGLAKCYVTTGAVEQAKQTLAMVPESKRNDATVKAVQASIDLAEQAQAVGPVTELEQKLAANPLDLKARQMLVQLQLDTGQVEQARSLLAEGKRLLGQITKETPDFLPAWLRQAEIAFAENTAPLVEDAVQAPEAEKQKDHIRFAVCGMSHDHIYGMIGAVTRGGPASPVRAPRRGLRFGRGIDDRAIDGSVIFIPQLAQFHHAPHVVLPLPFECEIELPLPQISGLAANVMRTVPFETRATLLAILCARAGSTAPARAARTTAVVPASDVILNVFIG